MPRRPSALDTDDEVMIVFRAPRALREQLRARAAADERSMSATLRLLCALYVDGDQ